MAIFAFGAYYGDENRMVENFINDGVVGTGWSSKDDITGHALISSIKVGDIVYLKRGNMNSPITVFGIGIIIDNALIKNKKNVKLGRNVKWLTTEEFVLPHPAERLNIRFNTAFEEFNPDVQAEIIDRIPVA